MSLIIDCNGYAWQVIDHYWRTTRRYETRAFYIVEAPYTHGPKQFMAEYGPFRTLSGKLIENV